MNRIFFTSITLHIHTVLSVFGKIEGGWDWGGEDILVLQYLLTCFRLSLMFYIRTYDGMMPRAMLCLFSFVVTSEAGSYSHTPQMITPAVGDDWKSHMITESRRQY